MKLAPIQHLGCRHWTFVLSGCWTRRVISGSLELPRRLQADRAHAGTVEAVALDQAVPARLLVGSEGEATG
jgi:hypothetical protein